MKCKYCGKTFQPNTKGKKRKYCDDPECVKKARNETQRKWYANKIKVLKGAKIKIIEQKKEKEVIYSSTDKEETKIKMTDVGDILQIARDLGTLRFQLIELITKNNEEISEFDKEDQKFLHKLEFLDELTIDEAVQMVVEEKKSRENRRNIKERRYLIQLLLNSILIKNPDAFIVKAIQSKGDICKAIANLKKDDTLYVKIGNVCTSNNIQKGENKIGINEQ